MAASHASELSLAEKQALYRDGFVVVRDAVPRELTFRARRAINLHVGASGTRRPYHELNTDSPLPALVNESSLGELMRRAMGPYDAPSRAFAAVLPPQADTTLPNYGWQPHLDGLWYSPDIPKTAAEVDDWQAPRSTHFGKGDATELGANKTPFFQDPACTLALGSFTAFVGVALNDQTQFGRGNLCLLKGAHHEVERFFRMQRDAGGTVGPEGPEWPRLTRRGEDGVGLTFMPEHIRQRFAGDATVVDGALWPEPTPILLDEGDAVIALHACPHGASINNGADSRMNVYFRLRRERPGGATVAGDSDHPDRGWEGEFLDYAESYDPWRVAIDAMCDHWREWDGMADVVAPAETPAERLP